MRGSVIQGERKGFKHGGCPPINSGRLAVGGGAAESFNKWRVEPWPWRNSRLGGSDAWVVSFLSSPFFSCLLEEIGRAHV